MTDVNDIKQEIADIQQTTSGLIESGSLRPILNDMVDLSALLGIQTCDDVMSMQALDSVNAQKALVVGVGLFIYQPLNGAVPSGSFASDDGQGYWLRQDVSRVASLLDVALSNPQNGQVLQFNSSIGKWENAAQSISSIGWNSITAKPSNIAAIASTDLLIKLITTGANKNIGTVPLGDDMVSLTPNGTGMTNGLRSVVISPLLMSAMTSVTDSIVITNNASLRPGSTPYSVTNCIIIGNVGSLAGFFNGDSLEDIIAIGTNGETYISKAPNGTINIDIGDPGVSSGLNVPLANIARFSNQTRADFFGRIYMSALNVYASNAAALSGEGGAGFLYRNSAGQVLVTF